MRYMGLDVGDRRIGVAVSDETSTIASGADTLQRVGPRKDLNTVAGLVVERGVGEVVVGLPCNMDGSVGPQAEKTLRFMEDLRRRVRVPVVAWDERLTTALARQTLVEAGVSRRDQRTLVDKVSAVLILQNYLDYRKLASPGQSPSQSPSQSSSQSSSQTPDEHGST